MCRLNLHPKAYRGESTIKKRRVYLVFIALENSYGRVNIKYLWPLLRMYDVKSKL